MVLAMQQHRPNDNYARWLFDGAEFGDEDYEYEVMYVRRRKPRPTLKFIPVVTVTPELEYSR
jgi:hypothetical protein